MINHREAFGFWLNKLHLHGVGVEVGSASGQFAATIAAQWEGKELWMVDPWASQDKEVYREATNEHGEFKRWLEECERLCQRDNRIHMLQMLSVDASKKFEDASLDWVYIDGNHSARAVMADLDAWWPKVKLGGIIGGHDFLTKTDDGWFAEVDQAVVRWTKEHNVTFSVSSCTSWWIHKTHP